MQIDQGHDIFHFLFRGKRAFMKNNRVSLLARRTQNTAGGKGIFRGVPEDHADAQAFDRSRGDDGRVGLVVIFLCNLQNMFPGFRTDAAVFVVHDLGNSGSGNTSKLCNFVNCHNEKYLKILKSKRL